MDSNVAPMMKSIRDIINEHRQTKRVNVTLEAFPERYAVTVREMMVPEFLEIEEMDLSPRLRVMHYLGICIEVNGESMGVDNVRLLGVSDLVTATQALNQMNRFLTDSAEDQEKK